MERRLGNKLKRNKKGSILDIIYIALIFIVFGMVLLIGSKITGEINTRVQAIDGLPTTAAVASNQINSQYEGTLDNVTLFLLVGLVIGTLVLAALVRIHPIFIPFFFIGLIFITFLCGVLSNVYQEMASTTSLLAEANKLTFTTHILTYLPLIVFIIGILLMIVMYKLWSVEQ